MKTQTCRGTTTWGHREVSLLPRQAGERGLGEPALLPPRPSISGLWNCGEAQVCYLSLSVPELHYRRPSKQIQNFTVSSERNRTQNRKWLDPTCIIKVKNRQNMGGETIKKGKEGLPSRSGWWWLLWGWEGESGRGTSGAVRGALGIWNILALWLHRCLLIITLCL